MTKAPDKVGEGGGEIQRSIFMTAMERLALLLPFQA